MAVLIQTPRGVITGYREAWRDDVGRIVWTWSTDRDAEPHDFGTVKAAEAWKNEVWCCTYTRREKADRDAWLVIERP